MSSQVLAVVLFAALLHAAWNALLKTRNAGADAVTAVSAGAGLLCAPALLALPTPDPASWPFIGASVLLHLVYFSLLLATYRDADFSHAYPLMRGFAPLLVALANGALFEEQLRPGQWLAVGLVGAGGAALSFGAGWRAGAGRATTLALLTAGVIAAYTLVDGLGARRAGTSSAAYTAWMFVLTGIVMSALAWRRAGPAFPASLVRSPGLVFGGGAASVASYGLALWAMTQAPVAVVAALRETSIVFAVAIAMLVLRERPAPARLAGAGLIALGAVAVRLA